MSSIDNRVVRMVFDNSKFKAAAEATKTSLNNVNDHITKLGRNRSLLNLEKDMSSVSVKAGKMQVAVLTAVGTIANKLTNAGLNLAKSLTIDPIKQGFNEYESLLNKQNVIMNATGKSAGEVKKVLANLNTYSDKTIFSFGDMTEALTTFVNAGVPLDKAQQAMRGIANASALAGASTQEAQSSFRAFGQALGQGFLGLQDFRQASITGKIGTVAFKQELINAGVAAGTLRKRGNEYLTQSGKVLSATKGFDLSLQTQWASATVLNTALNKYGDETKGVGKKAFLAATQVRTFSAFIDTTKEAVGSGFANVFTSLLGGLEDSTKTWTKLAGAVSTVVGAFFKFITVSLDTFRKLGGQKQLLIAFHNILAPFAALFKAVGDAFRAAFPKSASGSGSALYGLAVAFRIVTTPLAWLAKLISLLVHPLTVFFQIIRIGGLAIGGVIHYVVEFVKAVIGLATFKMPSAGGTDSILGWIVAVGKEIGRALGAVTHLLDQGKSLKEAFSSLGDFNIKIPKLPKLPSIGGFDLGGIFGGGDKTTSKVQELNNQVIQLASNFTDVHDSAETVAKNALFQTGSGLSQGVTNIKELSGTLDGYLTPSLDNVNGKATGFIGFIKQMAKAVADFFGKIRGEDVATSLNFAVLATIGITFAKFMKNLSGFLGDFRALTKSVTGVFTSLGKTLDEFAAARKRESQAKLIVAIAIALGVLAAALVVLSRIPEDKLKTAFKGLAGIVIAFSVSMLVMSKVVKTLDAKGTTLRLYALGAAMVGIGVGILAMAIAFKILATIGTDGMVKGLITIGVVFAGLKVIGDLAEKSGRKLVAAAAAMVIIGAAMFILAGALLAFRLVDYKSLAKGGLVLGSLFVVLAVLGRLPAAQLLAVGVTMLAIASAMSLLAGALIVFALVKMSSLGKAALALAALTASIVIINLVGGGAGGALTLVALGAAFVAIALGCILLNKVNWSSIGKAAAILGILVVAFAAFMVVVAVATAFGAIEALTALALGLALLAGAMALLVLSIAVILPLLAIGVGAFAAFAVGAAVAIATFLQTLALEAPSIKKSVLTIIQVFIDGLVEGIPIIIKGIGRVIRAIIDTLTSPGTTDGVVSGGKSIMDKLGDAIRKYAPIIGGYILELILKIIQVIKDNGDNVGAAAVGLIVSLINGIASKADDLVKAAADLIIVLIKALGDQIEPLAKAGIGLIVALVNGIADALRASGGPLGDAITNAISAMSELGQHLVEGISVGIGVAIRNTATSPWTAIKGVVKGIVKGGQDEADAHSPARVMIPLGKFMVMGLAKGITDNASLAVNAIASVLKDQVATASQYISKFVQSQDQTAIVARAKAEGLAKAADIASTAANKTKSDKDDKEAAVLKERADKASEQADLAEEKAQKAKDRADRNDQFAKASTIDKAKMRSEDATASLDEAKRQEGLAARDLAASKELQKLSKGGLGTAGGGGGSSAAQRSAASARAKSIQAQLDRGFIDEAERKKLKDELAVQKKIAGDTGKAGNAILTAADRKVLADAAATLKKQAEAEAKAANAALVSAKQSAADALALQKQAGKEAASLFQKEFDAQAAAAADQAAYDALSDEEKAKVRREDAAALQKQAIKDLAEAKKLAYTDLEAANELATKANEEADQARQYLIDAADLEKSVAEAAKAKAEEEKAKTPEIGATLVDLTASDAAAQAFANMTNQYTDAAAAAAAAPPIQFQQYNTSPEALSPSEVYRQTNNLLTYAADKLNQAAA